MLNQWTNKLSPTRIIALSFILVILTGTIFLMLPISSRSGEWVQPLDAFFTSTSATCVTGLVIADTFTKWSLFGQIVILLLIQVGGIGLMTVISMVFIVMKRKLNIQERALMMQAAGNVQLGGMVRLIKRILKGTLLIESIGAMLLAIRFIPRMGIAQGCYYAVFHSISAFCNAGFDLMGRYQKFSSFSAYQNDWLVCLTLIALIVLGGIGFLVWEDIQKHRIHFRKYSLHSKVILISCGVFLMLGAIGYFIFEKNYSMSGHGVSQRILESLFASATMRTAGFNTIDYTQMSPSSVLLSNTLMFVGGSPGSTAGGIKTTTVTVIFVSMVSMAKGNADVTLFKKRLGKDLVKQAAVILVVYLAYFLLGTMIICHLEGLDISMVSFEVISAICTVGVSMGITPGLGVLSHIILILMMYGGRIGGFSLMMVLGEQKKQPPYKRPKEKILIG